MIDELIEVEDAIETVASALTASDCAITEEVVDALLLVASASQRLSVAHFLFPTPSSDLNRMYQDAQGEVSDLFAAMRLALEELSA